MGLVPGTQEKHRYQTCGDDDCQLPYCRIYREGRGEGLDEGYDRGYGDGFVAGLEACPLPHGG